MSLASLRAFKSSFKKESIKLEELLVSYSRSSGPGGQNVNKVNTKVEVRLNVEQATFLPKDVKEIVRKELSSRINKSDELILQSDKHRTQTENYKDCIEKLHLLISESIVVPGETSKEKQKRVEDLQSKFKNQMLRQKKYDALKKSFRRDDRGEK